MATVALAVGVATSLGGTVAYSVATASVAHSGSIPSVGSSSTSAGGFGGGGGGAGGFGGGAATDGSMGSTTSTTDLATLLQASSARWAAATNGSQSAAEIELSTDTAVMAIGGWSSDPYPTLEAFEQYVADGDISYYISGGQGGGGMGGGDSTSSAM